jgi:hypothetical protein
MCEITYSHHVVLGTVDVDRSTYHGMFGPGTMCDPKATRSGGRSAPACSVPCWAAPPSDMPRQAAQMAASARSPQIAALAPVGASMARRIAEPPVGREAARSRMPVARRPCALTRRVDDAAPSRPRASRTMTTKHSASHATSMRSAKASVALRSFAAWTVRTRRVWRRTSERA